MTQPTWFEIECVDGAAATLYVLRDLHGADLNEIRMAAAALPRSVTTLRVQMRGAAHDERRSVALLQVLRHWREARGLAARVIMTRRPMRRESLAHETLSLRAAIA